jgi:hypothetical protein
LSLLANRVRINSQNHFLVDSGNNWVFRQDAVLTRGLSVCVPMLVAIGFASAPAHAQELIDVAALEAQVEAAAELTELPAEPDWGVPDPSNALPAVTQDAPAVPEVPDAATEAAPEPRYHTVGGQYHTEYQAPESNAGSPPAAQPTPPPASPQPTPVTPSPDQKPVPAEPVSAPAAPEAGSTPTIWIWVWNWTWVQGTDERYRNSENQYQVERVPVDQNLPRILEKIGSQMPVQIGIQAGGGITSEIMKQVERELPQVAAVPVVGPVAAPVAGAPPAPATPTAAAFRAPADLKRMSAASPMKPTLVRGSLELERPSRTALELATLPPSSLASPDAAPAPSQARPAGKAPRPRRASRPAPTLPQPSERITDASTASGVSAGIFLKSFAVLIASTLLAALGRGRRLRLPSVRWQGLLGTRTDPPG